MTPRIAFALAFAFACGTASADDVVSLESGSLLPTLPNLRSPAGNSEPTWQAGADGSLPVIEVVGPARIPEAIDLTAEPDELYQRMRRGFSMPNINNSLVLHHQQWYQNHPEYLRRMVERSSRYLHHIVEEIEKRGMPMELALLPMVESAYNPTAYSRSHASGLWQFVPSTGKQYKLEQNAWLDARRDIVASTAAALEYLQYIYELHGDWHLALASYNWGEGAVGRAINKNKAQGLPTDYLSLTMPEETRHYVPKLQALKNIFSNPRVLADLNIRGVPNRPYFATVTRAANIDVKLAAKLAEMPMHEFVALNPAHNRPVIKSETPLVIPTDKVDTFISNLEAHEGSDKPLSTWQEYTLRPGEKLEQVAPRFGMTVANLRAVNGINGRIKIAPGLTLLVAGQDGTEAANTTAPAGLLSGEPPPEPTRLLAQPRLPQVDTSPAPTRTHIVGKGETLLKVAQRYGMTLSELKQLNKLRTDHVTPGSKLAVAAPETGYRATMAAQPTTVAEADSKSTAMRGTSTPAVTTRTHTVQKGEGLLKIAQHYGMTLAELKQINRLRSDQVTPGTRLTVAVPEWVTRQTPAAARTTVAEIDEKPVREPLAATRSHTVQRGEGLLKIAQRYGMTLGELKQLNKLHTDHVTPGTRLTVAAPEPSTKTAANGKRTTVAEFEDKPSRNEQPAAAATRTHTVQKGEGLLKIAQRYDMTLSELKALNRLHADHVTPGTRLVVAAVDAGAKPTPSGRRTVVTEAEEPPAPRSDATTAGKRVHVVAKGETLGKIAQRYGMTVNELKQINKRHAEQVTAGTRLTVAVADSSGKATPTKSRLEVAETEHKASRNTDAHAALAKAEGKTAKRNEPPNEAARQAARKTTKLAQYTIRRGDTLGSIAKQFRVDKEDLVRWNHITAGAIKPGQTLTIQLVQNTL